MARAEHQLRIKEETTLIRDMAAGENFAEFFLEGILTPILGIFGFFGNVLSIKVNNLRQRY